MTALYKPVALAVFLCAPCAGQSPPVEASAIRADSLDTFRPYLITGMTAPRQIVTLGSVQPGRIARIYVEQGQSVREGELLFSLDDKAQRVRTEMAKAQAKFTGDVDLAKVRLQYAQSELDRLSRLIGDDYAAPKELRDTRLKAEAARLEYETAEFKLAQARLVFDREKVLLEQLSMAAPFSGHVTQILTHVGETVDEREGIVTVAQLDPLEIVLDCPLEAAHVVQVGDLVPVQPVDQRWSLRSGEVVFAARVADPASQTFEVKLLIPNADSGWMSGLKVVVNFAQAHARVDADPSSPKRTQLASSPADAGKSAKQNEKKR